MGKKMGKTLGIRELIRGENDCLVYGINGDTVWMLALGRCTDLVEIAGLPWVRRSLLVEG